MVLPLQTRTHVETFFSLHPSSCRAAMKRSRNKMVVFEGGDREISPGGPPSSRTVHGQVTDR